MNKLYWKLQSINESNKLEVGSKEFEIYREKFKKDFDTDELMTEEETVEHYNKKAYRSPLFSKIYSLTLAFVDNGQVRIKYITGEEKDLIQTFLNSVKSEYFKEYQLVHFGAEYILPYLGTRMDLNGFRTSVHKDLVYKGLRPWNLTGFCVRDYYQGAGNYKHSLKELAWIYGLECDFISHTEEFDYYRANKTEELKNSAINEIMTLVNVHRLMTGENDLKEYSIVEEKVEKVEEVKPDNILEKIYKAANITDLTKKELQSKLKKKKVTKKDLVIIEDILTNLYINNEMFKADSAAVKETKKQEIKALLDEIK